jgi:hypothetical protein
MLKCLTTVEKLPGKTIICVDNSGSMQSTVSGKSEISRSDAACALAIILREICEDGSQVVAFGTYAVDVPARRGFALRDAIKQSKTAWGTDTAKALALAKKNGYDRVIIVTDEQSATPVAGPGDGKLGYMINVASYQNGVGYGKWHHIDGWSEAIVEYIRTVEAEK